jgi:hypothetical protein
VAVRTSSPKVTYKKTVSDVSLKLLLVNVAEIVGADLVVHSGDRAHTPKGGAKKSLHKHSRAADLHAVGVSDAVVFERLRANKKKLEQCSSIGRFQVLRHGPYTKTEGAHIHIGDFHLIRAEVKGTGVEFWTEGLTPQTKGKYSRLPD